MKKLVLSEKDVAGILLCVFNEKVNHLFGKPALTIWLDVVEDAISIVLVVSIVL